MEASSWRTEGRLASVWWVCRLRMIDPSCTSRSCWSTSGMPPQALRFRNGDIALLPMAPMLLPVLFMLLILYIALMELDTPPPGRPLPRSPGEARTACRWCTVRGPRLPRGIHPGPPPAPAHVAMGRGAHLGETLLVYRGWTGLPALFPSDSGDTGRPPMGEWFLRGLLLREAPSSSPGVPPPYTNGRCVARSLSLPGLGVRALGVPGTGSGVPLPPPGPAWTRGPPTPLQAPSGDALSGTPPRGPRDVLMLSRPGLSVCTLGAP